MSIVLIVNIIMSLAIALGGLCMKKYASWDDRSIGFRTKAAMSDQKSWSFANQKCGTLWLCSGIFFFLLTIAAAVFIQTNISDRMSGWVQIALLILQIAAAAISVVVVEKQLLSRSGGE